MAPSTPDEFAAQIERLLDSQDPTDPSTAPPASTGGTGAAGVDRHLERVLAEVREHLTRFEQRLAGIEEMAAQIDPVAARLKVIEASLGALRGQLESAFMEVTTAIERIGQRPDGAPERAVFQLEQVVEGLRSEGAVLGTEVGELHADVGLGDRARGPEAPSRHPGMASD